MNKGGYNEWAFNIGFYCIYHCFLAIITTFGYESSNQTCTIALIQYLQEQKKINIPAKFIFLLEHSDYAEQSVIDLREHFTYGIDISIKHKKLNNLAKNCVELLDIVESLVN